MKRVTLTFTIVATLLASASTARADAGPKLPREAFYISPGLTLGGTSSFDVGTGFTLGGEISLLYWNNARYVGAVVDAPSSPQPVLAPTPIHTTQAPALRHAIATSDRRCPPEATLAGAPRIRDEPP